MTSKHTGQKFSSTGHDAASFGKLSGVVSIPDRLPSDEKVVILLGFADRLSGAVIAVGNEESDKALDLNLEEVGDGIR